MNHKSPGAAEEEPESFSNNGMANMPPSEMGGHTTFQQINHFELDLDKQNFFKSKYDGIHSQYPRGSPQQLGKSQHSLNASKVIYNSLS
jgi:hypothetical protein